MYEIREGCEEDRASVVELLTKIFRPIEGFHEEWIEGWQKFWNRPEHGDWAFVATHQGRVVANLSFFKNDWLNCIRGNPVCFGGVWAVGTEAEHRRQGLLRGLFQRVFPMMKEQDMVLSILDPSPYQGAQIAYEQCGYAVVERRVRHMFPPSALRSSEGHPDILIKRLEDGEEHRKVTDLEATMSRYGSRVFTWPAIFEREIKKGHFYLFERGSEPVGCANFSVSQSGGDSTLYVFMTYYTSNDVLPSIIALINQLSADAMNVTWICEPQIPIQSFFQNIHRLTTQSKGTMMMRVINFAGYCKAIQVSEAIKGELVLKLTDSQCPWNEGIYQLKAREGKLEVGRVKKEQEIELSLNPFQLSQVVGGLIPSSILQELGIIICSPETARTLEAIFPQDSFLSYFRF